MEREKKGLEKRNETSSIRARNFRKPSVEKRGSTEIERFCEGVWWSGVTGENSR